MNFIDKAIAAISPERALKRAAARKTMKVLNLGYSEGGASGQKKSMRGWTAVTGSPKDDIDINLTTLRARSRDLYMNSPIATASLKTNKTNVIGPGLRLKSRIDATYLGLSEDEADKWEKETERQFALWAESKHCDALRMSDFYDLQGIAFLGCLMNGDGFVIFKNADWQPWMPYTLRLHVIEADRVSTPWANQNLGTYVEGKNPDNGNWITSGVEYDDDGMTVAYHICNVYPINYGLDSTKQRKWVRVESYGPQTGRPNILHLMESERAEQHRGVPYLAPVIESLKQITRYTEAELMAAVIAGMFTVFIKSDSPNDDIPLGSMIPEVEKVAPDESMHYEMGNGAINVLAPGESVEIANPTRPNSGFEGFVNALCRYVGAALEIPQELLQKSFQSSYSASRAALLEAWKMFRAKRKWMAKEFCQPIYEEWLSEAVASGRIKAPGYFSDPIIRKAWSQADWNGPAAGQLDPLKEAMAAGKRIELGLSTREIETIEITGGEFDKNINQLIRESKLMQDIIPIIQPKPQSNNSSSLEGGESE